MVSLLERAHEVYEEELWKGGRGLDYLRVNRGLTDETISLFGLGYTGQTHGFIQEKLGREFSIDQLAEERLVFMAEDGSTHDGFRDRVIIPVHYVDGNLAGLAGRCIDENVVAKYLNTPSFRNLSGVEIFMGLHLSFLETRRKGALYLFEGYFDVMSAYQSGLVNVAALNGSMLTRESVSFLTSLLPRVTIKVCGDGDEAGIDLARDMKERLGAERMYEFYHVVEGYDPDEALRAGMTIDEMLVRV